MTTDFDFNGVARWRHAQARAVVLKEKRYSPADYKSKIQELAHAWDRDPAWVRELGSIPLPRSVPPAPEPSTSIKGRLDAAEAKAARAVLERLNGARQGD